MGCKTIQWLALSMLLFAIVATAGEDSPEERAKVAGNHGHGKSFYDKPPSDKSYYGKPPSDAYDDDYYRGGGKYRYGYGTVGSWQASAV